MLSCFSVAGYWEIPPNNYKWYSEEEKYKPVVQADGGILSSTGGTRGRGGEEGRGASFVTALRVNGLEAAKAG